MPQAVFIADLHLKVQDERTLRHAAAFFESMIDSTDQLFILGDLVEYWIGDDAYDGSLDRVFTPLSKLSASGCKIFLMHGNRDFLLGENFANSVGLTLISDDQFILDLDGRKILLMHGDTLCTDDIDYQAMRRQLRSRHWQQDFLTKSVEERLIKARQLRDQSLAENSRKTAEICDVNQQTVEQTMIASDVTLLLHGHTHRPAHHRLTLNKQVAHEALTGVVDHKIDDSSTGIEGMGSSGMEANRWVVGDWQAADIIYAESTDERNDNTGLPLRLTKWIVE